MRHQAFERLVYSFLPVCYLIALLIICFFIQFDYKFIKINRYHNWMKEEKSIPKRDMRNKMRCEMRCQASQVE